MPRKEKKMSIEEVAMVVENDGLGYAIQHYMNGSSIADKVLAEKWDKTRQMLKDIEKILYPDGYEAWENREVDDDTA